MNVWHWDETQSLCDVTSSLRAKVSAYFSDGQCCHCCFFSLDLGFLFYLGFLLKICFFYSGQILELYVVLLCFPFKKYSSFTGVMCRELSRARLNQIV